MKLTSFRFHENSSRIFGLVPTLYQVQTRSRLPYGASNQSRLSHRGCSNSRRFLRATWGWTTAGSLHLFFNGRLAHERQVPVGLISAGDYAWHRYEREEAPPVSCA
ncbi:hypothetical protein ARMGADRAFT_446945 [Armillaria gallica]|uniref:Uncharacterized protein n=1 Tax=Armillaria gallica TaxID=47427 RepID=A0A2H3CXX3_ARMGA|nr:hypothetical protein ARMGADRAFT_446945 [Armillaria gallica]